MSARIVLSYNTSWYVWNFRMPLIAALKGRGYEVVILSPKDEYTARNGDGVVVPGGTYHNVINASKTAPLKLYTIYSPPNHPAGTVHKTKADAEAAEKSHA